MSRVDAAATSLCDNEFASPTHAATEMLAAADAYDAAHGVHRVVLDDATVERAARALNARFVETDQNGFYEPWETLDDEEQDVWRADARAALSAAVEVQGG